MSRSGGKRGGRHVTPEEAALWKRATHALERVKGKPRVAAHALHASPASVRSAGAESAKTRRPEPSKAPGPAAAATSRPTGPPAELDRRAFRQIAAGKVAIDARLDLHGLRRGDAHARLRAFLLNSHAQGHRVLLVITGKGGDAETDDDLAKRGPERGILRRSVPQWLEEPELRGIVLGWTAAGPRHGGGGALYVRLRKARDAWLPKLR